MKRKIDWEKLKIFHVVVEYNNFTKAAKFLGMTQPSTSRAIKALEESLGVTLFKRHSRGLVLTEEGETLYETTQNISTQINRAQSLVTENKENPQGTLTVVTTLMFGSAWLAPRIKKFRDKYPEIDVNIIATDAKFQEMLLDADCAIQFGTPTDQTFIKKTLFYDQRYLCGTKEYFEKNGTPKTLQDLDHHDLIVYSQKGRGTVLPTVNWLLTAGIEHPHQKRKAALVVNNAYGVVTAVCSGLGIGIVPIYQSYEKQDLVKVLEDYDIQCHNANFLYPKELKNSQKIELFKNFMIEETKPIRDAYDQHHNKS